MDLKKQFLVLAVVVSLVGVIQLAYDKYFDNFSTPANAAKSFMLNHQNVETAIELVINSDQAVMAELKGEYLKLTKLPQKPVTQVSIAADVTLSETAHKVDLQTEHGLISLNLVKETDKWKVFLNLSHLYQVQTLLANLAEAEAKEDEVEMLSNYEQLNELLPSEVYQEKITRLKAYITQKREKAEYVQNIQVSDLQFKGRVLTGLIKNSGNRTIQTVKANIQVLDKMGQVSSEIPVVLFEVIPGSFVFGENLKGGYQKKFGLNVVNVPQIKEVKNLVVRVVEVEFAP